MPERSEFAAFLRSRRERTMPEDVGLPPGGRRRTPGLRREELAALAGISVDYVVRLEQGRETNPSTSVLAALARTLRLTPDEMRHLKGLVAAASCGPFCPDVPLESVVDDTVHGLLASMDTPAFVLSYLGDVLAYNDAYEHLMSATGLLEQESPNLLRYTFLDQRSRELYREWEATAREQVGNLRSVTGPWRDEAAVRALVGELSVASDDFARLWAEHDVEEKRRGTKDFVHPVVGGLQLIFTTLLIPEDNATRLVVYMPCGPADQQALDQLSRSAGQEPAAVAANGETPGRLRLVGS